MKRTPERLPLPICAECANAYQKKPDEWICNAYSNVNFVTGEHSGVTCSDCRADEKSGCGRAGTAWESKDGTPRPSLRKAAPKQRVLSLLFVGSMAAALGSSFTSCAVSLAKAQDVCDAKCAPLSAKVNWFNKGDAPCHCVEVESSK